jgi:hypothetical protein
LTDLGWNRVNIAAETLKEAGHEIRIGFKSQCVRIKSLEQPDGSMKIICSSKKGHEPLFNILENVGSVAVDTVVDILPIFLQKIRTRKGKVKCGEQSVLKSSTKGIQDLKLRAIEQKRRGHPDGKV